MWPCGEQWWWRKGIARLVCPCPLLSFPVPLHFHPRILRTGAIREANVIIIVHACVGPLGFLSHRNFNFPPSTKLSASDLVTWVVRAWRIFLMESDVGTLSGECLELR